MPLFPFGSLQTSWFRLLILLLLLLLLLPHICDTFRYDILRISGTLFVWVIKKGKLVRHRVFFVKTGEAYVNSKQTPFEVSFLYFDCNLHTHDDEPHPHLTHIQIEVVFLCTRFVHQHRSFPFILLVG